MDTVWFFGRVYPAGFTVNAAAPGVRYVAADGTLSGTMDISVVNSAISVRWTVEGYSKDSIFPLWRHAERMAKAVVDLIAFKEGAAAVIVLDSWTDPGGHHDAISIVEPAVKGLATSLQTDGLLLQVFGLLADQQELLLVLEDLIATLASQDHKTINCARCVEAVRHLIAGYDLEPKQQWPIMRDKLNLDAPYLKLITDNSTDHRHGKQTPIEPEVVTEIMIRTWTVIDRYFHYKISGDKKLDTSIFPVLTAP